MTREIPLLFARSIVDREGASGKRWLADLPGLVEALLGQWDCVPDGEAAHGGIGMVLPVSGPAGRRCVLKVSFPHPDRVHEPDAFAVWAGRGAVLLHERDDDRCAMLLERARPSTLADVADGDEVMEVAGQLSRRLAVPAPPGLPRLRDRADAWEEQLLKDAAELEPRLPDHLVDAALATVRELGRDQPDTLLHGDLHERNILRADREPWLAIDPEGWAGDPAFDAGTLLKSRALAFLTTGEVPKSALLRALNVFADAAGLDRERARRWAQLHAVQDAFHGRRHGMRTGTGPSGLDWLTALGDHVAQSLAQR
ncbi:aminoglycoside phosphotransferase family protein [Streptomyces sp. DSM 42041]|uniref:Aminoglycoside phosphotransferase family protein n=1 Tax=Streptomyces hazeniae TaxID=3075538 RepID=A0ABU2NLD6_9ACTN|nr:aminoglycoside phosphotransferase family protein [Streptomyces sp. DSM 42041]MDT0377728.1 aminoglycoside phosphotransferase family protein [Streptomyces sp. DSM 42041]